MILPGDLYILVDDIADSLDMDFTGPDFFKVELAHIKHELERLIARDLHDNHGR